mgnify:CR=1 FL=1
MREKTCTNFIKWSVLLFIGYILIYPLANMILQIQIKDIGFVFRDHAFKQAIMNSIKVTSVASIFSLVLGYLLAYTIMQTNIKLKEQFKLIITLPMLLPSISHGLGLINLFGENGLITKYLNINIDLYGFNGIVIGSVIYTLPVAFLMLLDGMRYIDRSKYEVVEVMGIPKRYHTVVVMWPYMKKPICIAFFAIAAMIFTDYGIPLAIGGRYTTLATYLYTEVIGLLDFSKGAIVGCILLIPSILNFLLDVSVQDIKALEDRRDDVLPSMHSISQWFFKGICILVSIFIIAIIISFSTMAVASKYPYDLTWSIKHMDTVVQKHGIKYLFNSIWISSMVAILGSVLTYGFAYITTRFKQDWLAKLIHMIAMSSIAIPGIVLGLSYIMSFKGTFIYKTIAILILVNIVHFLSSPYLMAYNAMQKLNKNYEDIGKSLRIGRLRLIKDVFIPNTINTILEMFEYFFINSMTTISAVTFLYGIKNMPVSIMVNQFIGSLMFEEAAIISLMILITNLVVKVAIKYIKRRY